MKRYLFLQLIVLVFFFASCHDGSHSEPFPDAEYTETIDAYPEPSANAGGSDLPKPQIQMIRKAWIDFETESPHESYAEIKAAVSGFGGYLAGENSSVSPEQTRYGIEVRIPSEHFEAFIDLVGKKLVKQGTKRIEMDDVTEQYVDLQARLNNKKRLEETYSGFMTNANTVDDMLRIEYEINMVREDIERMQAQLNHMSNKIRYCTVYLDFYNAFAVTEPGFGTEMLGALENGWEMLKWMMKALASIWPLLLAAAFAAGGIRLLAGSRRPKQ